MTIPRKPRSHLTYANVASTLALALAVGGGTAYAAGLVDTDDIKKGAVTTPKLAKNAATSGKIKNGSVKPVDLAVQPVSGSVTRTVDIVFPDEGGSGTGISKDAEVMCEAGETVLGGGYHLTPVWSQSGQPTVIATATRPSTDSGGLPTPGTAPQGWYVRALQKDNNTETTVTVWVLCGS